MDDDLKQDNMKVLDRSGMLEKILEFPRQLRIGWELGNAPTAEIDIGRFSHIVFGGMGGSAITGDLLVSLFSSRLSIPFFVNRGYKLPGFTDSHTLFFASSYSGNTEETLSATQEAIDRGCQVICVTSGGKLGTLATEHKFPVYTLPPGYPPRAALGYNLGLFLALFRELGISEVTREVFDETVDFIEKTIALWTQGSQEDNVPLRMANEVQGKIPLIYASSDMLGPVGFRWKTQINENSKCHVFFYPLPEMSHNEIMGWQALPTTKEFFQHFVALFLRTAEDHPRIQRRFDITKQIIEENGQPVMEVRAEGSSYLARMLYLIALGDLFSFYLSILYGVDPTEIQNINTLKDALSRSE